MGGAYCLELNNSVQFHCKFLSVTSTCVYFDVRMGARVMLSLGEGAWVREREKEGDIFKKRYALIMYSCRMV